MSAKSIRSVRHFQGDVESPPMITSIPWKIVASSEISSHSSIRREACGPYAAAATQDQLSVRLKRRAATTCRPPIPPFSRVCRPSRPRQFPPIGPPLILEMRDESVIEVDDLMKIRTMD